MSDRWAVRFARGNATEAHRLWQFSGVEVCEQGEVTWLQGDSVDDHIQAILRGFLSGQRFLVLPDGQLQSPRSLVPSGYLPDGPWIPFHQWMSVDLPATVLPGQGFDAVELRLVRSDHETGAGFLLTNCVSWFTYGCHAPRVRLKPLRFAVASDGRVMVRGRPLPSMAGQRFADHMGLAVPLGWTWPPTVAAQVVRETLRLGEGDVAVFFTDGGWGQIAAEHWVHATRQAIRLSCEANDE